MPAKGAQHALNSTTIHTTPMLHWVDFSVWVVHDSKQKGSYPMPLLSLREAYVRLKGLTIQLVPWRCKAPLSGTNHGAHATPSERACHRNTKNWTINWDISSQPHHQTKRTSFIERTHLQPSVRIENLEWLHQKILKRNMKRLCNYWSDSKDSSTSCYEQSVTMEECSCKSKNNNRH
jgi:hypothetical protein